VACAWETARRLPCRGENAADHALLEVLAERIPERYGAVLLASGDGIFIDAVTELVAQGVEVTVVAHEVSLSNCLRAAASICVLLSGRSGDAA
jgi:hypothetical protein